MRLLLTSPSPDEELADDVSQGSDADIPPSAAHALSSEEVCQTGESCMDPEEEFAAVVQSDAGAAGSREAGSDDLAEAVSVQADPERHGTDIKAYKQSVSPQLRYMLAWYSTVAAAVGLPAPVELWNEI